MQAAQEIAGMTGLQVQGLMTMAPWGVHESTIHSVFERTQAFSHWLKEINPQITWSTLSMGMTNDFPLAIATGATYIRVGRALFGSRH